MRFPTTTWLAAAALVVSGCPQAPPNDRSGALDPSYFRGRGEGEGDPRAFTDEEKAQSRGKLGGPWVSCYATFQPTGDARADLGRLAAGCGRPTGLAPITPVRTGEAQGREDPVERFTFQARGGRCYRFFAVASAEVGDLDVAVLGPDGRLAANDVSRDKWPVVPARGPLCVDDDGVYTIEVAVAEGTGSYALEVWGSE